MHVLAATPLHASGRLLIVFALLLTVAGSSVSARSIEHMPGHSHLFLTAEAAANHDHSQDTENLDVVSLASTDLIPGGIQFSVSEETALNVSYVTTYLAGSNEYLYLSPIHQELSPPPQYS